MYNYVSYISIVSVREFDIVTSGISSFPVKNGLRNISVNGSRRKSALKKKISHGMP